MLNMNFKYLEDTLTHLDILSTSSSQSTELLRGKLKFVNLQVKQAHAFTEHRRILSIPVKNKDSFWCGGHGGQCQKMTELNEKVEP